MTEITVQVNGTQVIRNVADRRLLSDFIRSDLGLTGTHVGCEHGYCGACAVLVDGDVVRSCLMLAVQAQGKTVQTVESLALPDGQLHPIQQAFWENHGLQCGFCTPGILMTVIALLEEDPEPGPEEIRTYLAGNICRCTGYVHIVQSILAAAGKPQ